MELSGYFRIARRWWLVFVASAVLAALGGYAVASRLPKVYEAEVRVLVGPLNTDLNTQRAAGQLANTYAQLASSARHQCSHHAARAGHAVVGSAGRHLCDRERRHASRCHPRPGQRSADRGHPCQRDRAGAGELGSESPRVEGQVTVVDPATASATAVAPRSPCWCSLRLRRAADGDHLRRLPRYARDLVTSENELQETFGLTHARHGLDPGLPRSGCPLGVAECRIRRSLSRARRAHRAFVRGEACRGNPRRGGDVDGRSESSQQASHWPCPIAASLRHSSTPTRSTPRRRAPWACGPPAISPLPSASGQVPLARLTLLADGASDAESRSIRLVVVPSCWRSRPEPGGRPQASPRGHPDHGGRHRDHDATGRSVPRGGDVGRPRRCDRDGRSAARHEAQGCRRER